MWQELERPAGVRFSMKYSQRISVVTLLLAGWMLAEFGLATRPAVAQRGGGGRGGRDNRVAEGQTPADTTPTGVQFAQPGGEGRGGRGGRGGRRGRGGNPGGEANANARGPGATPATPAAPPNPRDQAIQMFTTLDRNGDKMLQADEARPILRGPGGAQVDANNDGVVSQDELVAGFTSGIVGGRGRGGRGGDNNNNSENQPSEQPGRGNQEGGRNQGQGRNNDDNENNNNNRNSSEGNNNNNNRNQGNRTPEKQVELAKTVVSPMTGTYRLKTAKETPQQGLPSWFTSRDKNGDGQVTMLEYAARLTESQAQEFIGRDTNGDGLITAGEASGAGRN